MDEYEWWIEIAYILYVDDIKVNHMIILNEKILKHWGRQRYDFPNYITTLAITVKVKCKHETSTWKLK